MIQYADLALTSADFLGVYRQISISHINGKQKHFQEKCRFFFLGWNFEQIWQAKISAFSTSTILFGIRREQYFGLIFIVNWVSLKFDPCIDLWLTLHNSIFHTSGYFIKTILVLGSQCNVSRYRPTRGPTSNVSIIPNTWDREIIITSLLTDLYTFIWSAS